MEDNMHTLFVIPSLSLGWKTGNSAYTENVLHPELGASNPRPVSPCSGRLGTKRAFNFGHHPFRTSFVGSLRRLVPSCSHTLFEGEALGVSMKKRDKEDRSEKTKDDAEAEAKARLLQLLEDERNDVKSSNGWRYEGDREEVPSRSSRDRVAKVEKQAAIWTGDLDESKVIEILRDIVSYELAGVVRYSHYALMVKGPNRIPIVQFLKEQASESLLHAQQAGEILTGLGGQPKMDIARIEETNQYSIYDILAESYEHEAKAISLYRDLLRETENQSVYLEEYARGMVGQEELHRIELRKMLRDFSD